VRVRAKQLKQDLHDTRDQATVDAISVYQGSLSKAEYSANLRRWQIGRFEYLALKKEQGKITPNERVELERLRHNLLSSPKNAQWREVERGVREHWNIRRREEN
jgi:hypothetical protein